MQVEIDGIADPRRLSERIGHHVRLQHYDRVRESIYHPAVRFQDIARLACRVTQGDLASVVMVEPERVVILATHGWTKLPREKAVLDAFCAHTVAVARPVVISDARRSLTLKALSAVSALGVVAYLGVPVMVAPEVAIGTVCAFDRRIRKWEAGDIDALIDLSALVLERIHNRNAIRRQRH